MPAAWAGVAIAAGSAIAGGLSGSGSVGDAANKAQGLSQATIDKATQDYQDDRAPYQNYLYGGQNALAELNGLSGTAGPEAAEGAFQNFQSSPGYQYQVQQGLRAVDAGAAANGILRSGATLKAEQTLGNNLANQNFQQYVGNLNTLANYGLTAAKGQADTTTSFNNLLSGQATNQEGILTGAGAAQASIYGNTIQGVGNAVSNGLTNYAYRNSNNNSSTDTPAIGSTNAGQTMTVSGYKTPNTFNAEAGF